MVVVGLTGGIGSGKSLVASMMGEMGARVYDADEACHQLLMREDIIGKVVDSLGPKVWVDGRLDRKAMADRVFSDRDALLALEGILHPEVHKQVMEIIYHLPGFGIFVVDAPLLHEADHADMCDVIIHVTVDPGVLRERIEARGWTMDDLERRAARQLPEEEKAALGNAVIDNSGSIDATREQVERVWRDHVLPLAR
jgi:dephospho-CoA kinase